MQTGDVNELAGAVHDASEHLAAARQARLRCDDSQRAARDAERAAQLARDDAIRAALAGKATYRALSAQSGLSRAQLDNIRRATH